ncbi:MAG: hypothetical protein ACXIUP_09535, partial [Microcella sp.]
VDDASYDLGPTPGDDVDASSDEAAQAPADTGAASGERGRSALLAATSVFGGVYLMYTVGWIIGVAQLPLSGTDLLQEITYQFAEFLAIIAAPMWFVATLVLSRGRGAAHRLGWLAVGTLVLVPWPFLLGVIR